MSLNYDEIIVKIAVNTVTEVFKFCAETAKGGFDWLNTKNKPIAKKWRNVAEQWMGDKDAFQYKKEEGMDAYEKQEAHIKKLREEARRWG